MPETSFIKLEPYHIKVMVTTEDHKICTLNFMLDSCFTCPWKDFLLDFDKMFTGLIQCAEQITQTCILKVNFTFK